MRHFPIAQPADQHMRLLVLGAGGTGGYFGGRLAQGGADVTFLVRKPRSEKLRANGLVIRSPLGDATLEIHCLAADELAAAAAERPFDLVLLSCKAYDLQGAIDAVAPAVSEHTRVLPILNGLRHYDTLDARFGASKVIGGHAFISVTKAPNGEIVHLGKAASLTFGERDGESQRAACRAFAAALQQAGIDHEHAGHIQQAGWNKYSFLTALAAGTCLMRASIGEIVAAGAGEAFMRALFAECCAVAEAAGWPIAAAVQQKALGVLTQRDSPLNASMLRDLQAGQRTEGAHIVGDMLQRARHSRIDTPLLDLAWTHLLVYEEQRASHQGA